RAACQRDISTIENPASLAYNSLRGSNAITGNGAGDEGHRGCRLRASASALALASRSRQTVVSYRAIRERRRRGDKETTSRTISAAGTGHAVAEQLRVGQSRIAGAGRCHTAAASMSIGRLHSVAPDVAVLQMRTAVVDEDRTAGCQSIIMGSSVVY